MIDPPAIGAFSSGITECWLIIANMTKLIIPC